MMEMYVTNILSLRINNPTDLIESNDVEDLTENNELFKLMQQYTVFPIYDLYHLNVNEWLNQPWKDIQFQLKMARQFKKLTDKTINLTGDEEDIILDETHKISRTEAMSGAPTFKKHF